MKEIYPKNSYLIIILKATIILFFFIFDSGNLKITNLDRLVFTKNGEFMI